MINVDCNCCSYSSKDDQKRLFEKLNNIHVYVEFYEFYESYDQLNSTNCS